MKSKITVYHISMIAFAIVINLVGGQIALMLKLPIYLDSMGTIFIAAVYGPFYGAMPSILSGLILGMTSDIYALYYAPVGILLGMLVGIVWKKKKSAENKSLCCFPMKINATERRAASMSRISSRILTGNCF